MHEKKMLYFTDKVRGFDCYVKFVDMFTLEEHLPKFTPRISYSMVFYLSSSMSRFALITRAT
jgi:hypothetical protein